MSDLPTPSADIGHCVLCAGPVACLHRLGERAIVYCDDCELGQQVPLPTAEELRDLYSSHAYFVGSDNVGYSDYLADRPQFERTFRRKFDALLAHRAIDDLLEIGCGTGLFLQQAKRAGVRRVLGVDQNPWAIEQACRLGIDARLGSIDNLVAGDEFDAAVMLDVVEHIREPIPFLRALHTHLRPGGLLLIMTPNIRSVLARLSGARWVSFKLPEHVFYYSPRSIRVLLERAGFETLSVKATGQYVTVEFLVDRLRRIAPLPAAVIDRGARALGWMKKVVFVSNGSMDVVARARS